MSMISKYHNHTLQTKPQHREEERQNNKSHKTSMTDLTWLGNMIKQQPSGLCTLTLKISYLLFNGACATNNFPFPIYVCAILFDASCPNYAQWMTMYRLDLLYIDEAHAAACVMFKTGAVRPTNKQTIL